MPIIGFGDRVPGPIGGLEVFEYDARVLIFVLSIAPDIEVALLAARRGAPGALKPRVLIGSVIEHQLGNHAQTTPMRFPQEQPEIFECAVIRMDLGITRDIVTVIAQWRRIKSQKPNRASAEIAD